MAIVRKILYFYLGLWFRILMIIAKLDLVHKYYTNGIKCHVRHVLIYMFKTWFGPLKLFICSRCKSIS